MRFRRLITTAVLAVGVVASAMACGTTTDDLLNTDTAQTAKQEALNAAAQTLEQTVQGLGFENVKATIENEEETVKVVPSRSTATKPRPSSSATPTKPASKPKPSASTVKFQVISVDATFPRAFRCGVNVEQRLDKYGVPTGAPYFNEVLVPGTDGVEVKGDARNHPLFQIMSRYVFDQHPECVLPGVTAAPTVPVPASAAATPTQ